MCKDEHRELIKALKDKKNLVSKSAKESKKFLVDLGVVTEKGNLRRNYRSLCIPIEQV
jgi:hypothetical protein